MLYYLYLLQSWCPPLRIFRYITVRAVAAAGTAFFLTLLIGPWAIAQLRRFKTGQRADKEADMPFAGKRTTKAGIPTMGGLLILAAIVISAALWTPLTHPHVWLTLTTLLYMGCVGFLDDLTKLRHPKSRGLRPRSKLLLQAIWAIAVGGALLTWPETRDMARRLMVPLWKEPLIADMTTVGALLFILLVMVGASNAVNLTDGLDGLAIGCTASVAFAYLVMSYVAGHAAFAAYLLIPYIRGAGELAVLCGSLLGASLGFLWFNCSPASVFMGDTGSLALGGALAMIAILIRQELVLVVVGGVFVMEALSVILQVASLRLRGRRLIACSPLHHHFELKNWSETQIVVRFWILGIVFSLAGILLLKIR